MGSGSATTLPAKRPLSSEIPQMTDPPNPNPKSHPKRSKKKQPPPNNNTIKSSNPAVDLPIPAGHASFRLLCHSSRIGGVIGKAGSVIKTLQIATGSKIHVEKAAPEVPDRVVVVVAPAGPTSRVAIGSQFGGGSGETAEVTKAQEALLRVFDRILEVAAESGAVGAGGFGVVSCRLLADSMGASAVIGKGGKVVEKIRKETGTKIKVFRDDLPACASPTDELIEIEGDVLAVKKALVSVSQCLQACFFTAKTKPFGSCEAVLQETLPDRHLDNLSQRNFVSPVLTSSSINLPKNSINYSGSSVGYPSGVYNLPMGTERVPTFAAKAEPQEVAFKILCSNDKVGGVIGKGGLVVRALQNESGATISVGNSIAESDDRVITITALEDPETRYSPAQKAVVMVFSKSENDSGLSKSPSITARLVVLSNQVGCILGKGGAIISEIRKTTGANIRILGRGDQVPKCLSSNEEVVQISGDFSSVQDALYNVTGRLRDNLLSSFVSSAGTTRNIQSLLPETSPYGRRGGTSSISDTDPYRLISGPSSMSDTDPYRLISGPSSISDSDPYRRIREPGPLAYATSEPQIYDINGSPYVAVTSSLSRHTTLSQNLDNHRPNYGLDWPTSPIQYTYERPPSPRQHTYDRPPSPRQWSSQMVDGVGSLGIPEIGRGLSSMRGGFELGGGNKSAIVTNTTVEIIVPENVIGSVYGENGNNLTRLRQISGARVIVHEPRPGTSDRVIVISGTPDETQAAQSLLHAFILTG